MKVWTPPDLTKSEGDVVKDCMFWLLMNGCFVWRNNTGSKGYIKFGKEGSPDIIGVNPKGKFIGVECKSGKNKQNDEQIYFQREIESKQGIYVLAYDVKDLIASREAIL